MPRAHIRKPFKRPGAAPLTAEVMPVTKPPTKKAMRPMMAGTQLLPCSGPRPTRPVPIASSCRRRNVTSAVMRPARTGPHRELSRRAREPPSRSWYAGPPHSRGGAFRTGMLEGVRGRLETGLRHPGRFRKVLCRHRRGKSYLLPRHPRAR